MTMHSEDLSVIRALLDHVADRHLLDEEQWQG
jgi:hypothetical protein